MLLIIHMTDFLKNSSLDDSESEIIRKQIIDLTKNYYQKTHSPKKIYFWKNCCSCIWKSI